LSKFDDDESTVDGDVSSLPREESDAYGESEVVTPDPNKESLSDTDQVMEDSSFQNMEFQFSEDELNFLMRSSKLLSPQVSQNSKNHINALIHLVTPRKNLFFLTRSNPRTSISKALICLMNTIV
jgi:hypothetical protein